jgi:hypothetical protein
LSGPACHAYFFSIRDCISTYSVYKKVRVTWKHFLCIDSQKLQCDSRRSLSKDDKSYHVTSRTDNIGYSLKTKLKNSTCVECIEYRYCNLKKHELIDESITKKINVANGICNGTNNQIVDNFLHVLEFSLLLNKKQAGKAIRKKIIPIIFLI